jgi:hypothetical protein
MAREGEARRTAHFVRARELAGTRVDLRRAETPPGRDPQQTDRDQHTTRNLHSSPARRNLRRVSHARTDSEHRAGQDGR